MKRNIDHKNSSSSWEKSSKWYGQIVGNEGHYYHQHVVLPFVIRELNLNSKSKLVDIGCGQGVLARAIKQDCEYVGVDAAQSLIKQAKSIDINKKHTYVHADATKTLPLPQSHFTHAAIILALQNMKTPIDVLKNASDLLETDGKLVIVLNHPCFRIPRQSGWDVDESNKLQKRWISRYLSPMEIPISMHPGKPNSEVTYSYHYPLTTYSKALASNNFFIEKIDELVSDKESQGKQKKMENRSRSEIPLFLAIVASKNSCL